MISRIGNYKNILGTRVLRAQNGGQGPTCVPKMGPGGSTMEARGKLGGQRWGPGSKKILIVMGVGSCRHGYNFCCFFNIVPDINLMDRPSERFTEYAAHHRHFIAKGQKFQSGNL